MVPAVVKPGPPSGEMLSRPSGLNNAVRTIPKANHCRLRPVTHAEADMNGTRSYAQLHGSLKAQLLRSSRCEGFWIPASRARCSDYKHIDLKHCGSLFKIEAPYYTILYSTILYSTILYYARVSWTPGPQVA